MKKIVALLLAMVITAGLWAGGTAAYASIYTVTTPNITVDFDGGSEPKVVTRDASGTNWEPGYTSMKNIRITGDVNYTWNLKVETNSTDNNLAEAIDVYWAYTADIQGMTRSAALGSMTYIGTLEDLLSSNLPMLNGTGNANEVQNITVALKMRESAGNDYQGKTAQFSFTVTVSADAPGSNP
jgi:hypothetical protein